MLDQQQLLSSDAINVQVNAKVVGIWNGQKQKMLVLCHEQIPFTSSMNCFCDQPLYQPLCQLLYEQSHWCSSERHTLFALSFYTSFCMMSKSLNGETKCDLHRRQNCQSFELCIFATLVMLHIKRMAAIATVVSASAAANILVQRAKFRRRKEWFIMLYQ